MHLKTLLGLLATVVALTIAPQNAFAGCDAPQKALDNCNAAASRAQGVCEDDCQATHAGCYRANHDRANAQAGCDDRYDTCKERCGQRGQMACVGVEKAKEKCEEKLAEQERVAAEKARIAAEKAKLAECRKRWGAETTVAACDEKDAKKAKLEAADAKLLECRKRWGATATPSECAAKAASEPRNWEQVWAVEKAQGKGTFRDNGDGTVAQTDAGLVWQKADSGERVKLKDAAGYCAGLGLAGGGWRLPGIDELARLAHKKEPIDAAFSNSLPNSWSATPFGSDGKASNSGHVWCWGVGTACPVPPSESHAVRCVR